MCIRHEDKHRREFQPTPDTVEAVASFDECNKTKALMLAADQVPKLHTAIEDVLERHDLTLQKCQEIAARFNQARDLEVQVT